MYNDACAARDAARKELQQVEQVWIDNISHASFFFPTHILCLAFNSNTHANMSFDELLNTITSQEFQAARGEREAEKKRLDLQAEERRRQYEAIEKRLRLASMGDKDLEGVCVCLCVCVCIMEKGRKM